MGARSMGGQAIPQGMQGLVSMHPGAVPMHQAVPVHLGNLPMHPQMVYLGQ